MLSFNFLGQVSINKDGVPLSQFRSQKEKAVLIYLAQTGLTHRRDFMADLLWDDRSTQQALRNLRTTLSRLRKQVGDGLHATRTLIALTPENRQQVDSVILLRTLTGIRANQFSRKSRHAPKSPRYLSRGLSRWLFPS